MNVKWNVNNSCSRRVRRGRSTPCCECACLLGLVCEIYQMGEQVGTCLWESGCGIKNKTIVRLLLLSMTKFTVIDNDKIDNSLSINNRSVVLTRLVVSLYYDLSFFSRLWQEFVIDRCENNGLLAWWDTTRDVWCLACEAPGQRFTAEGYWNLLKSKPMYWYQISREMSTSCDGEKI